MARLATDQMEMISHPLLFPSSSSVPFHLFLLPSYLPSFLLSFHFSFIYLRLEQLILFLPSKDDRARTDFTFTEFELENIIHGIYSKFRLDTDETILPSSILLLSSRDVTRNVSSPCTRRVARFCVHGIYNSILLSGTGFDDVRDKLTRLPV